MVRGPIQEAGRVPLLQTASQRRRAPSTSQLKRLDSRHDPGSGSVRELGSVCVPPKTKTHEQNTSVENAT